MFRWSNQPCPGEEEEEEISLLTKSLEMTQTYTTNRGLCILKQTFVLCSTSNCLILFNITRRAQRPEVNRGAHQNSE